MKDHYADRKTMDLPPFLLDHWLARYDFADPPIRYNLASSTGPRWSVDELSRLGRETLDVGTTVMSYAPPEGCGLVREAVADFHGVEPDWVVMTTGASEALSILLCLAERPNGNVVIPDPAYPAYAAMARAWRLDVRSYSLNRDEGFAQESDAVLEVVTSDTVAVIVNTPHNPTGSVMQTDQLAALAAALGARGVPLLVDEVYHPLYFGEPLPSAASIDNVIVMSDLSKAMSLPGLRTGWIIDRDAARRRKIIDARSYFTVSSSPLLERLAAHALEQRAAIFARLQSIADRNIGRLETLIEDSRNALCWSRPCGGTTTFPWFSDGRDSRPFCQALADAGVLVAPGDCFGHASHMRIGFAQQADQFEVAVEMIGEAINQTCRARQVGQS
jgi:aspartate/methionine/tyrosine aminotransferase